jgi:hypothetical protein
MPTLNLLLRPGLRFVWYSRQHCQDGQVRRSRGCHLERLRPLLIAHGIAEEPSICTNRVRSWQFTMLIRAEDGGPRNHVCCDAMHLHPPSGCFRSMYPASPDPSSHPSASYMTIICPTCALVLSCIPAELPMQVRRCTTLLEILQLQHIFEALPR